MVTSASVAFAYNQHESTFYYAERQAAWLLIGFVALFVLGRLDYRRIRPLAPAGAVAAALLMLLVLVPHLGVSVNGARRWFDAGPLGTFQPSELGKLASRCSSLTGSIATPNEWGTSTRPSSRSRRC